MCPTMPPRTFPCTSLHGSHLRPLCSTEDGSVQNAATDADSVLDVLKLRLQKLRASTGEDVLTANCMFELARRLEGRARYGEAEKLYRECLRTSLDLSLPQGATVIALVLHLVFFRSTHKGNWCSIPSRMFSPQSNQSCIKVAFTWFPKKVMANA